MKKPTKKVRVPKEEEVVKHKVAKIIGECHDGEDLKCEMADGTIGIFPKESVEL